MKNLNQKILFSQDYYLTDGGIETSLIFHHGADLNHFAAFELLNSPAGISMLEDCFMPYLQIAAQYQLSTVIETPTWRANPDWGYKLGYSIDELKAINKQAVAFIRSLYSKMAHQPKEMLVSGNIGPRGDGYLVENAMTVSESATYHAHQIHAFAMADVDLVTALTINYTAEGIGIIEAAKSFNIPVVISYTVETDGRLPNGDSLQMVIEKTDLATGGYAEHYMINCAHPEHFSHVLAGYQNWKSRIKGVRANASCKSHSELEEMETLDTGNKEELASGYLELKQLLPNLKVIGGCCGTDHSHIGQICQVVFDQNKIETY